MKFLGKLLFLMLTLFFVGSSPLFANTGNITGAGSTFIYPLMSLWAKNYSKIKGENINYQPIGSGGGLRQIYADTIDFAASDMPLSTKELDERGLIQFPVACGGIVPIINVKGINSNELVLNGNVLSNIYMGNITFWDDAQIQKLNPDLKLPHSKIILIVRADGSGTTYNFTNYLAKANKEWNERVGYDVVVKWPSSIIGSKGNAGVAAQVKIIPNSIGYVEYAYIKESKGLIPVKMINKDNQQVTASATSFYSAASSADWTESNGFYSVITDAEGKESWPIAASTFVLIPKKKMQTSSGKIVVEFFIWALKYGQEDASSLDYIPMPKNVVSLIILKL